MTIENVEFVIKKHNHTLVKISTWSFIPYNFGMRLFKKHDDMSQVVRFHQYKTGKSLFAPECWREYRMNYC